MPFQFDKQKIILIAGVILGLVAVFMVKSYVDQQNAMAIKNARKQVENLQANQTAVLVAKQDIPKGSAIESSMLDTQIVPNKYVQPQAATSLDRISGMITSVNIAKDEQITLSKLVTSSRAEGGSLAAVTPVGKRAITISVDNVSSLGGMIKPGDYLDVIAMVTVPVKTAEDKMENQVVVLPLFQNVLVLAVGQDLGGAVKQTTRYSKEGEGSSSAGGLITLALSAQEASLVAFIQEQGRIRLTLRSPADAKVEVSQPANWETLFRYINPTASAHPDQHNESRMEAQPVVEPTDYVEIYRGLKKESVPISK